MIGNVNIINGDVTKPVGDGGKIIAHVVNDAGKWGAGVALAISTAFPYARERYMDHRPGIGMVQTVRMNDLLIIANMCAMHNVYSSTNPHPLDYKALDECLRTLYKICPPTWTVHMPKIGAGLARGNWNTILAMITRYATVPTTIYLR